MLLPPSAGPGHECSGPDRRPGSASGPTRPTAPPRRPPVHPRTRAPTTATPARGNGSDATITDLGHGCDPIGWIRRVEPRHMDKVVTSPRPGFGRRPHPTGGGDRPTGTRPWSLCRVDRVQSAPCDGPTSSVETPTVSAARQHRPVRHLVTGATGYVGGRLAPRLAEGDAVRCLVRVPAKLRDSRGRRRRGGARRRARRGAVGRCEGVDVAYYLVHSWSAATSRGSTAAATIVAAGGARRWRPAARLPERAAPRPRPLPHLASRAEVGDILRDSPAGGRGLPGRVVLGAGPPPST